MDHNSHADRAIEACVRSLLGFARDREIRVELHEVEHGILPIEKHASAEVKDIAKQHLERIDHKIAELKQMRATLARLVHACAGDQRPDCPILADLATKQGDEDQLKI